MTGRVAYLDSSAFVKLIVPEPESEALRQALLRWSEFASAALLRTEVIRALRRSGNEAHVGKARRLMRGVNLVRLDELLLDRAADLAPTDLRSLDAVHLVAASTIGDDLGVVYLYDTRLARAAEALGMDVDSPGWHGGRIA
ncbi:MAG: type II toxin-antitoxin system VapC family toxin [Acidimicrobiales bacterium]